MAETSPDADYDKSKQRRNYPSARAIDPHDGGEWDVLISPRLVEETKRRGMGRTRELVDAVRWALLHPASVYRGIRDIDNEIDEDDGLCYVAAPPRAYDYRTGEQRPAWNNEVMLVFVNEERVLFNWFWVKVDPSDRRLPVDHEIRFREKVF